MTAFIIKSSVSLILLFGVYWFLTRKEKLFVFNRFFLIFSILFSLVIPFISIPVNFPGIGVGTNLSSVLNNNLTLTVSEKELMNYGNIQPVIKEEHADAGLLSRIGLTKLLLILYFSGAIVFLFRFLRNLIFLSKRERSAENVRYKGFPMVLVESHVNPHCFLKTIFVNREDYENNQIAPELLTHELEHIRQFHSVDIIFLEMTRIIYWFNPILILYNRAIRVNHEYLADHGVLKVSPDIKSYAEKLLSFINGSQEIPLVSGCNNSLTKKRLIMLTKTKSNRIRNGVKIILTLNLVMLILFVVSTSASAPNSANDATGLKKLPSAVSHEISTRALEISQPPALIQKSVKGLVQKEDGTPLEGVNVSSTGRVGNAFFTSSGKDGRFSLNNVEEDAFIGLFLRGYKSQNVKADFNSEMIIKMVKDPDYKEADYEKEAKESGEKLPLVVFDGVISKEPVAVIASKLGAEMGTIIYLSGTEATKKYGAAGKNGANEIYSRKKAKELGIKVPFRRESADDYPTFQGKSVATFADWLAGQISYPDDAAAKGVGGTVTANYTVELDGSISNIRLFGRTDQIGEEVMKAIKSSPKWEPAKNPEVNEPFQSSVSIKLNVQSKKVTPDDTFVVCEEMPMYPGGDAELLNFIKSNTNYPQVAKSSKVEGRVIIRFVVSKNGDAVDPVILRGIDPFLDAEALRVIGLLKGFSPGKQGGTPVDVYYMAPVTFTLPVTEPAK